MRNIVLAAAALAGALGYALTSSEAGTLIPIQPVDDSTAKVFIGGINDSNVVTGSYANQIAVREKHVRAANLHSVVCPNGCVG
jgi:hypothetical protein